MQSANAATANIVVNAFGELLTECTGTPEVCNTTAPEFNLYINGTKVAGPQVVTETETDYTFNNITVPTSGNIEVDVHFFNDNWCGSPARAGCTGDHNFYINTVKIHAQTIASDGETVDRGDNYAQATDGSTVSNYSTGSMNSNSALRLTTTFADCCSFDLIAYYELDEGPWDGTADEVKDTAGYAGGPFDGISVGNPELLVNNPASGDAATGSCGYAHMVSSGTDIRIDGLPVNTATGAQTSVSFWMYWKGAGSRMPMGWNSYDLWFAAGNFGFNTWASDLYGISSAGLADRWVHVVAVFTNGDASQNEIYIDGVKQTLTQRNGTFNNSNGHVTPTVQMAGSYNRSGHHWDDSFIDEFKIYNGAITQAQVNADFNASHTCPILRPPLDNLALAEHGTIVTTSHVSPWEDLAGVNDNVSTVLSTVEDKNDGGPLVYGNWDGAANYGATNWVSFELSEPKAISEFQVLWWDDGGGISAPTTAEVEYFDGTNWISIGAIGTALDTFNSLVINGIATDKIRVKMSSPTSTGIIEVRIFGDDVNKLIAQYHLDEPGWNGTADEVKDSGGHVSGPFHGAGFDSPIASSETPAKAGDIGTCGYASFPNSGNSGSLRFTNLPVNQAPGARNAISFWMYWNGGAMPIGFNGIDIWFSGDSMGFNTWAGDLYGVSNVGMANKWVHVVAVITNGDVQKNQLFIDGVPQTLSQLSASPNNANAFARPDFAISGTPTRTSYRWLGGYIDEVKIYNSAISQAQVTADFNASHICNYELVAKYHMDEISWDGTAGEVRDTSSNGYHGEAMNGATTKSKNRAIEDDSNGTCGYGVFNGANAGSRVNLSTNFPRLAGSKTITAWVKLYSTPPSGKYSRIFVDNTGGQFGYGLKVNNNGSINYFKRKSSGAKQSGNAYSLTLNEWYFIAFKLDDDTDSITFYTYDQTGTLLNTMTSTGYTDDITSNAPTGQGASIGAQRNGTHFMDGQIDELRIYKGALTTEAIEFIKDNTHPCGTYPAANEDAHAFNCIAEQVPDTEVQTGHLYMQRAQQPFSIKVAALKADGTLETGFTDASAKDLTLAFLDKNNSNTPIEFYDPISASNVTSATVNFPVAGTGIVQVDGLSINKAYKRLTCQIIDSNGQTITGESTDAFSVRPTALSITSSANADDSGTTEDATPFIKAGSEFTLSATGVAGYDGTLLIDTNSSNLTAHTGSHQKGSLTGTFATAAEAGSGTATGSGFKYSEVGYFKLAANSIYDNGDYTNVDSDAGDCTDDFSNTTVAGQYGCKFGNTETNYFGRFIPDHFNIKGVDDTDSTVAGCQINAAPANAFTYYGYGENEDGINTKFSIEAVNATNVITENYKDSYATLDVTTWNDTNASTGLRFSATNIPAGASLLKSNTSTTGSWLTGSSGNIMAYHYVPRLNTPMAPAEIDIQVTPVDRDGVTTADGNPVSVTSLHKRKFKYGRVKMTSVSGSNLRPLSMPIVIQSWNGTAYSTNEFDNDPDPNDNCTNIPLGKFSLSNYQQNLADGETTASDAGVVRKLSLSAPGVGNNGNVDITVDLSDFPWLDLGSTPTARASFGTRSGRSPVIYMRENF